MAKSDIPLGDFGEYKSKVYDEKLAMSVSVGGKADCHYFVDLQEDSCIYIVNGDFRVAAVTDAHGGAISGMKVIEAVKTNIGSLLNSLESRVDVGVLEKWMIENIFPVSVEIADMNEPLPFTQHSRTQLTIVLCNSSDIYYAQFGDSRSYILSEGGGEVLSPVVRKRSLGFPMTEEAFILNLKTGHRSWKEGDEAIIVCSDGFPEVSIPEPSPETVTSWARPFETAEEMCANMMNKAFELEACDNLSLVCMVK